MSYLLPNFFHLLGQAQEDAESVDDFDVVSGNRESEAIWNGLLRDQHLSSKALIAYIMAYGPRLLEEMDKT